MSDKNQLFHLSCNKKALSGFVKQAINSIFAKYHTYPLAFVANVGVERGLRRCHSAPDAAQFPRQN